VPACDDCGEFKDRTCAGGRDPVECFLAKAPAAEPGGEHRQKKRDPMLGLGAQGLKVRKTPKPKDQSKMWGVDCFFFLMLSRCAVIIMGLMAGFIGGAIVVFVYNFAASHVGPIEMDLEVKT
jgi:hypothetical protein